MPTRRRRELTWKRLIELCLEHGKERVLALLIAETESLEGLQAALFAEPESVNKASRMSSGIIQRTETIVRLRAMSEETMRSLLKE